MKPALEERHLDLLANEVMGNGPVTDDIAFLAEHGLYEINHSPAGDRWWTAGPTEFGWQIGKAWMEMKFE